MKEQNNTDLATPSEQAEAIGQALNTLGEKFRQSMENLPKEIEEFNERFSLAERRIRRRGYRTSGRIV